jgi:hypothetical protein
MPGHNSIADSGQYIGYRIRDGHYFPQIFQDISFYQLDFLTPGICPAEAISRKQIRHKPKWRM